MNNNSVEVKKASIIKLVSLYLCLLCLGFSSAAQAQSIVLGWDATTNTPVAGYIVYCGGSSGNYSITNDVGTNTVATISNLKLGSNYFFAVSSYTAAGLQSVPSTELAVPVPLATFFDGQQLTTNGVDYLQFTNGTSFGYFQVLSSPWINHSDMGYEYVIDANDGQEGMYLYDWTSNTYWYTDPALFPYLYDFTLSSWLYYFPDSNNPGHYSSNPRRFFDYATQSAITK